MQSLSLDESAEAKLLEAFQALEMNRIDTIKSADPGVLMPTSISNAEAHRIRSQSPRSSSHAAR